MRLHDNTKRVEAYGIVHKSETYSIENTKKIYALLSDKMYKDKPLAVVREYFANAYDAMVMAGNETTPITVHVPNQMEPWFEVEDYGTGLSHKALMHLFSTYGASESENTNLAIGGLGIGSKSGFAYTNSFTVVSRHKGTKRTYACVMDNGTPSITLLNETKSDVGPNGLTVRVPVNSDDTRRFTKAIRDVVSYFPTKPTITGAADFEFYTFEPDLQGKGWSVTQSDGYNSNKSLAIMGYIAYPISDEYIKAVFPDKYRVPKFILDFDIGELDVSASREELSYDDETIAAITARLEQVKDDVVAQIGKEIRKEPTYYDAVRRLNSSVGVARDLNVTTPAGKYVWRGMPVKDHIDLNLKAFRKYHEAYVYLPEQYRLRRNKTFNVHDALLKTRSGNTEMVGKVSDILFVHTTEMPKRLPSRLCKWYKERGGAQHENVMLFVDPTGKMRKYLERQGVTEWLDFETEIPDLDLSRGGSTARVGTSRKTMKLVQMGNGHGTDRDYWNAPDKEIDIDVDTGYYVDIYRHQPRWWDAANKCYVTSHEHYSLTYMQGLHGFFKKLKVWGLINEDAVLYGVTGSASKNHMRDHANWKEITEHGLELIEKYQDDRKDQIDVLVRDKKYDYLRSRYSELLSYTDPTLEPWQRKKGVIDEVLENILDSGWAKKEYTDLLVGDDDSLRTEFDTKYPLVNRINWPWCSDERDAVTQDVIEYMKGIDNE